MRLTQFSDYALRLMMFAAANEGRLVTIDETAKTYNISQEHLKKVANQLTKTGFLSATRGRFGGLQLAQSASTIKLGDIVRATEPDFAIAECMSDNNNCKITSHCKLKHALKHALRSFLEILDQYTLHDIAIDPEILLIIEHE